MTSRSLSKRAFLQAAGAAVHTAGATGLTASGLAQAQQASTLRFHQMLPAQAIIPSRAIAPWIAKVERESGGRLKIQQFNAMQLGGTPPQLFDQARDGVVDITWTVLGYTAGRFNRCEVFELPFMISGGETGSRAFQEYVQNNAMEEFKDVKLICVHTHGAGLFHTKEPVDSMDDLRGMKIRAGSRVISSMLAKLGATPVGMPVPAITDALSKGTIVGATIPWEVAPSLKVHELVKNHTAFAGKQGLYTQTFAVSMNKAAYDKLPADLKKVMDDNSGMPAATLFGRAMDEGDKVGLEAAKKAGNRLIALDVAETQRWKRTASTVETDWIKEMAAKGIDGPRLIAQARAAIEKYNK